MCPDSYISSFDYHIVVRKYEVALGFKISEFVKFISVSLINCTRTKSIIFFFFEKICISSNIFNNGYNNSLILKIGPLACWLIVIIIPYT